MKDEKTDLTRRSTLKRIALLGGMVAVPALTVSRSALAAKAPKQVMQYQDSPKNGQQCSTCIQYIAGDSPDAMGKCKIVAGDISPKGWCVAYVQG